MDDIVSLGGRIGGNAIGVLVAAWEVIARSLCYCLMQGDPVCGYGVSSFCIRMISRLTVLFLQAGDDRLNFSLRFFIHNR